MQLTDQEQRRLIAGATEQLKNVQDRADKRWRFMSYARWDFDADRRTLTFSHRGRRRLVADVRATLVEVSACGVPGRQFELLSSTWRER